MAEKACLAVLISGTGSNMAALLYASRIGEPACEVVLVLSNKPEAPGLALAEAEGVTTAIVPNKGLTKAEHERQVDAALRAALDL